MKPNHRLPEQILESLWSDARDVRRHNEFLEFLNLSENEYQQALPASLQRVQIQISSCGMGLVDLLPLAKALEAAQEEIWSKMRLRSPFNREDSWAARDQIYAKHIRGGL